MAHANKPAQGKPAQGKPAQGNTAQAAPAQAAPAQAAPAQAAPAQAAPAQAPAPTHHAGIALTALPKNIAQRGATGGVACPPKLAGVVLVQGKPYTVRATHVGLWVQAAVAQLAAAGGRATGAQLCAPIAIPVQAAVAQQYGLQAAPGQPGHYMVQCPGHVLQYVLHGPIAPATA